MYKFSNKKEKMLKVIGINGSPRKNWNTDLMIQSALRGAADAGHETKLYQLSELNFKGCCSCLHCKKSPETAGECVTKDDLYPILKEIKTADALIFGSPVYFSFLSGLAHNFYERLMFSNSRYYAGFPSAFPKKLPSLMIYTMNMPEDMARKRGFFNTFEALKVSMSHVFHYDQKIVCAYNTQQVKDYSKYDIRCFDHENKYKSRREQFPIDLETAYKAGFNLIPKKIE